MYIITDTETGGTKAETDALLQIGAIICEPTRGLPIVSEFKAYIYPPEHLLISEEAKQATGIDAARFYGAEDEAVVAKKFAEFIRTVNRPRYVGFNSPFDLGFYLYLQQRTGESFDYEAENPSWICLMRLTRQLLPKKTFVGRYGQDKNPRLSEACAHFGIEHSDAHDALSDTHRTRLLWLHLQDVYGAQAFAA